ncbi:LysR substrate-binding domain-containing protein [Roseobacter sp. CCS2]|uniref:LysR substrate-binding domain-containing protein n=1 Tax=Roseobacter sp. CCS2 TaxID=391593 RepID=UPI000569C1A6|nr:LysR substrate-binding domain-containing protein [Roseobacter sp. CCS2]
MTSHRYRLRELEALRALVTSGTTVGAARRLGVSQSGVSRAISQLEARVGRTLFMRRNGRVEATEEALRLNGRLDPIFDTLSEIEGAKWAALDDTPLRLAVPPSLAHHFIMPRIARFIEQNPKYRIQFDIQASENIVTGILEERFDLGLTSTMAQRSGVTLIPWRTSSIVCAMPEGHVLAQRDIVTAKDLDGQSMITFLRRLGTRAATEQIFAQHGIAPREVAATASNVSALELVREGLGLTLLNPFPILSKGYPGIIVRPFDAAITYQTCFAVPAGQPATTAARQFMNFIRITTPRDSYSTDG